MRPRLILPFLFMAGTALAGEPEGPKPRLYAFFATWCVPCRAELPTIDRIRRKFGDELEVVLVSIDAPSSASEVSGLLSQLGISTPWVLDPESELLVRYQPAGQVPFTVLLDEHREVVYAHSGYEAGDEVRLEAEIVRFLSARAAAKPKEVSPSLAVHTLAAFRNSRFARVDDPRLGVIVSRFEPALRGQGIAASARVDQAFLVDQVDGPRFDLRLERGLVDVERGHVRLRLGDNYVRLGRGMTLSLRRVDPLGTDTALRGGRVDVTVGAVRVSGIAGLVNPQNYDPIEMRVVGDSDDRLAAAEVEVRPARWLVAQAYALGAQVLGAGPDGSDVTWTLAGGAAAIETGRLRVAAEGASGVREGVTRRAERPVGLTGSLSLDLSVANLLCEAKWYRHFDLGRPGVPYGEPPTLERQDQRVSGNADSVGGRGRLDVKVHRTTTIFASGMYYRFSTDGTDPIQGSRVWHAYGGADLRVGGGSLMFSGGYRDENDATGADALTAWHVELDGLFPLPNNFSLSAGVNHTSEKKVAFTTHAYVRGLGSIGLARTGLGGIAFLYGWSTEVPTAPTHYPGAELKVLLPRGGEVRLFGGRIAGGRVCVSGACRDLPPFEGVRLEAVLRL